MKPKRARSATGVWVIDIVTEPKDRMTEAEVAVRLAVWLISLPGADPCVEVGIDGAAAQRFPVRAFLRQEGWRCVEPGGRDGSSPYQGVYRKDARTLRVHARPGVGDVIASAPGQQIFAECKGGPLSRSEEGKERTNLVAAVGQLVCAQIPDHALPVAAVPDTEEFRRLARLFLEDTIAAQAGIRIALVDQNGAVDGLW